MHIHFNFYLQPPHSLHPLRWVNIVGLQYSTVASHPFLGFRLTRELENFLRYHVLGPHLGHTARVDVDFRSGAHLFYGVMS